MQHERRQIHVFGIVQGVGYRPFVWQLAHRLQLAGWVNNDSAGVTIEVQGNTDQLDAFVAALRDERPPLAVVDEVRSVTIPLDGETGFTIVASAHEPGKSTPISPDMAICDDCLRELRSPEDRRYRYPFINCTHCGPRFTIIRDLPYDRPVTTMQPFAMCSSCQREYDNPADRRFHAQPNACPDCGPRMWFVDGGNASERTVARPTDCAGDAAIEAFRGAIRAGRIVAVKGIGGFHLACDATNSHAIATLRERKGRIEKPFAVMMPGLDACREVAELNERAATVLTGKERPIVLLPRRAGSHLLSDLVAPGNDYLGLLLPYAPLHYLLLDNSPPLVMTSANVSDEPIVKGNREAVRRLGQLADDFLLHDREIHAVCDDSVVRCVGAELLPVRRSRGYAPMPLRLRDKVPDMLAVGGELKATFCLTHEGYAYVSQHIGDMGNLETLESLRSNTDLLQRLLRVEPELLVGDLHPGYLSTEWARRRAAELGVPFVQVQHHFSHAAALAVEHRLPVDASWLCLVFDGTGYGTDGAIWGGEAVLVHEGDYRRFAHLKYVPLPGGDASIRHPYRTALSHLHAAGMEWSDELPCVRACSDVERRILTTQLATSLNAVPTSSMGRLFDAVAALVGVRQSVNYEAQAAMELEALASRRLRSGGTTTGKNYSFRFNSLQHGTTFDAADAIAAIVTDLQQGVSVDVISLRFHQSVAALVVAIAQKARDEYRINRIGLSGGVYQNVLLLQLTNEALTRKGFEVLTHRLVPPNDGGICLGQVLLAARGVR